MKKQNGKLSFDELEMMDPDEKTAQLVCEQMGALLQQWREDESIDEQDAIVWALTVLLDGICDQAGSARCAAGMIGAAMVQAVQGNQAKTDRLAEED